MSSLDNKVCSQCEARHTNKDADAWFCTCEKAYCNKCRYTHLSSHYIHKFISIQKYNKLALTVHKICKKDHKSKFYVLFFFANFMTMSSAYSVNQNHTLNVVAYSQSVQHRKMLSHRFS